jgi:hypothetical protein
MKYIITEIQLGKINNMFKGIPYGAIIEYIKINYNPYDVDVKFPDGIFGNDSLLIIFKFKSIDDSFGGSIKKLENEIRKDILSFFNIKTSGVRIGKDGTILISPYYVEPLSVSVQLIK